MTAQLQRQTEKPTTNIGLAKVGRSAKFELTEFLFPICTKPQNVTEARLALTLENWTVIKNGLKILGVSTPERM